MDMLPDTDWSEPVISLFFGVFAGWILYSRGVGLKYAEKNGKEAKSFHGFSAITVNILLGAVCLIYAVYLLSGLHLAVAGDGDGQRVPGRVFLHQGAKVGLLGHLSVVDADDAVAGLEHEAAVGDVGFPVTKNAADKKIGIGRITQGSKRAAVKHAVGLYAKLRHFKQMPCEAFDPHGGGELERVEYRLRGQAVGVYDHRLANSTKRVFQICSV